jgi:hypothetical protein
MAANSYRRGLMVRQKLLFFFFCDFQVGFHVIFNSVDLLGLFTNFFLDLIDINVVLL